MEEASSEGITQILEILWDFLGIKKSVVGINIRRLLTDQICSVIADELGNKTLQKVNILIGRSNSELNKIASDIMRLLRVAVNMSSTKRKILFCALLLAIVSALFPYENVESIARRVMENA